MTCTPASLVSHVQFVQMTYYYIQIISMSRSCLSGSRSMRRVSVSWRALRRKPGHWALSSSNWKTPMKNLWITWRPWSERTRTFRVIYQWMWLTRQCIAAVRKKGNCKNNSFHTQRRFLTSLSNLAREEKPFMSWRRSVSSWSKKRVTFNLPWRKQRYYCNPSRSYLM